MKTRDLVLDDICTGSLNWDQHEQDLLFEISSQLRAPQWQGAEPCIHNTNGVLAGTLKAHSVVRDCSQADDAANAIQQTQKHPGKALTLTHRSYIHVKEEIVLHLTRGIGAVLGCGRSYMDPCSLASLTKNLVV
jgi:hypothetical protein